jgi:signal peptidase II
MSAETPSTFTPEPGRPSGSGPARPFSTRVRSYRLLWVLALTVFALDQITKIIVNATIPFSRMHMHHVEVIPDFFYLIHVGNDGAAWSMLSGKSGFLAGLAIVTLGAIYIWRRELGLKERIVQLSFGLLCGGIVGNLVDRMLHGHVIDFLDFHFGSYVYPTFNIADAGICVGVGIYLIHSLRHPAPEAKPPA